MGVFYRESSPIDIFVSHDWPKDVARHGDMGQLLRKKPFLKSEIDSGTFGSPPGKDILYALRPQYWFAAHMHCKYPAVVHHGDQGPPYVTTNAENLKKKERGRRGEQYSRFFFYYYFFSVSHFLIYLFFFFFLAPQQRCARAHKVSRA